MIGIMRCFSVDYAGNLRGTKVGYRNVVKISQILIKFIERRYINSLSSFYDCIFLRCSDYYAFRYIQLFHSEKQTFSFAEPIFS